MVKNPYLKPLYSWTAHYPACPLTCNAEIFFGIGKKELVFFFRIKCVAAVLDFEGACGGRTKGWSLNQHGGKSTQLQEKAKRVPFGRL